MVVNMSFLNVWVTAIENFGGGIRNAPYKDILLGIYNKALYIKMLETHDEVIYT